MLQTLKRLVKDRLHVLVKQSGRQSEEFKSSSEKLTSFNPRQMRHYEKLLDIYWDPANRAKRFHLLNHVRIPLIYNFYISNISLDYARLQPRKELRDIRILDVGCGGGICSEALARLCFDVTGIDPNPKLISVADKHQKTNVCLVGKSLRYYNTTVEEFSETHAGKYDAVLISEVLEYIPFWKQRSFLESCIKCCKNNGNVFLTIIAKDINSATWASLFLTERNFNAVPISWWYGINSFELTLMLQNLGCRVENTRGIKFDYIENNFVYWDKLSPWYFVQAVKRSQIAS